MLPQTDRGCKRWECVQGPRWYGTIAKRIVPYLEIGASNGGIRCYVQGLAESAGHRGFGRKTMGESEKSKIEKSFDTANDIRKFEIGLFWQRSLFFWGFIGAAFVAFAAIQKDQVSNAGILVACFGLVCSVAWSLLNRGSKYWQEFWEEQIELLEEEVLERKLFGKEGEVQDKGWWLSAKRYSVSKLAIALSDFTSLVWLALIYDWLSKRLGICEIPPLLAVSAAILYAVLMVVKCRTSPRS
jgi:hypothetical protein